MSASGCRASHARLWIFTFAGLALDLWSKAWALANLDTKTDRVLIEDVFLLRLNFNKGALWGMGQGLGALFIAASLFATGFVIYVFLRSGRHQRSFHIGLGMVLSGALGNMYDRIFHGHVRDFLKLDLHIGSLDLWPWVFNVADVFLVVGVALLMINIWFEKPAPDATTSSTTTT
jgi:signal peptidase II